MSSIRKPESTATRQARSKRKKAVTPKNRERGNRLLRLRQSFHLPCQEVSRLSGIPFFIIWQMECGRFDDKKDYHLHLFASDGDINEQRLLEFYEDYRRDPLTQSSLDFLFWVWWGFLKMDPTKYKGLIPNGYTEQQEEYGGSW